ncbi:Dihydrodiol dehydrogenase 3 [Eumeta japonica]|uniref:Dihydrodiol dehydrogenase 3 n=1 Tax=Eumeta variegata TaxID=151549 RepID=A0A4C1XBG9_EUMVA|nr:Dihydrodiol dehydrogenase 3 [Eumeta japonica]
MTPRQVLYSSHRAQFVPFEVSARERCPAFDFCEVVPKKNPPPNVEEINLAGTIPEITNNLTKQQRTLKPDFMHNLEQIIDECVHACDVVSKVPAVRALFNSSMVFDLVIVEVFGSECFLPLGRRFDAPVVGLLSSVPLPWVNEQLGNPEATAYVPAYMMGYGQRMTLWERFANTMSVLIAKIIYRYNSQIPSQAIANRLFGAGPSLEVLAQEYSLVLSNSHFSINEVRPLVPALVEVGGLHLDDTEKLPRHQSSNMAGLAKKWRTFGYRCFAYGDISLLSLHLGAGRKKQFELAKSHNEIYLSISIRNERVVLKWDFKTLLDTSLEGVVYWSFGSMSRIETMPRDALNEMFSVLAELPLKILVKMNRALLPPNITIPGNVYTKSWIPQYKTLCHSNLKLFISHGGLLGIQEAVACGVPMLVIPLYADQALNARAMVDRGIAKVLSLSEITSNAWRDSLHDLLTNHKYKENAISLQSLFLDRPLPPLEMGVYWIEYVLRHKGAKHLRSPALDLHLYQKLLLDIILINISTHQYRTGSPKSISNLKCEKAKSVPFLSLAMIYHAASSVISSTLRVRFQPQAQAPADVVETTVSNALKLGYNHIDTAFNYNNEEAIGKAIKNWINSGEGTRDDLFITTKLPHVANRASDVRRFVEMQLERLQLDYLNLYLIHVPFGFHCDPEKLTPVVLDNGNYSLDMETNHVNTWKAMEECHKDGLIHNLGLSNFNQQQIAKIIKEVEIKPQVLQVELHAQFQQIPLRTFCMENDIVVTAYAPLGSPGAKDHFVTKYNYSPDTFPNLLGHPDVKEIAAKHNKTPAQVLLNFLLSQGVTVIPKSTSEARLKENMDIYDFVLSPEEICCLKNLDRGEEGRIFNFLFWKGVEKHPEYPFPEQLKLIEGIENTQ